MGTQLLKLSSKHLNIWFNYNLQTTEKKNISFLETIIPQDVF